MGGDCAPSGVAARVALRASTAMTMFDSGTENQVNGVPGPFAVTALKGRRASGRG